jgi:hypothetical protein
VNVSWWRDFGPDVAAPGRWVARLPAQRLEAGKRIAVDLWLDYSGTGEVSSEGDGGRRRAADVQRMAKSWTKRSGALERRVPPRLRCGPLRIRVRGRWTSRW